MRGINMPPVTLNLIIINILIWLVEILFPSFAENGLFRHCGLHYIGAADFNPAQIITYMFLHDRSGIMHIFFNMFSLFMFGPILERTWGSKRFFMFYMVCGIGAGLLQEGVWALTWHSDYIEAVASQNGLSLEYVRQNVLAAEAVQDISVIQNQHMFQNWLMTIGASGAIFGLLLGFAFVFPNMPMYLFFIPIPVKAKWMVLGYAVIEFFLGVNGGGIIAHFAHLGGMLFGLAILLIWKKKGILHGNRFY